MKIVVTDGYTLNPGDLRWEEIEKLGELTVYERTAPEELLARARDAEALLTNKTPIDAAAIARLARVRYIGVLATGYNVVDVAAAAAHGVAVTNIPAYSTLSVAQLAFALILEHCHHVQAHSEDARSGAWSSSKDFSYSRFPLVELSGKTLGVVGYGRIGGAIARLGRAFGMEVIAAARAPQLARGTGASGATVPPPPGGSVLEGATPAAEEPPVARLPLEELLPISDVICLTCPLAPETTGMINRSTLALTRRSAFLVNVSRGGLIVEADLADALARGQIAGAGLDVLGEEPPRPDNPLLSAPNCIITPHIAWATREARSRLMGIAAANLRAFLEGNSQNIVSPRR